MFGHHDRATERNRTRLLDEVEGTLEQDLCIDVGAEIFPIEVLDVIPLVEVGANGSNGGDRFVVVELEDVLEITHGESSLNRLRSRAFTDAGTNAATSPP